MNLVLKHRKENNMTQEDKELLLKYLCMALPYGVIVEYNNDGCLATRELGLGSLHDFMFDNAELKPYLRPMSSMTEKEHKEYEQWLPDGFNINTVNWLLKNHFDFMGLIPKGLAIEVTEDNNPYKE